MSRTLFENSKAALAFAGITILAAVVMVGSDESGGVLDQTVERISEKRETSTRETGTFTEAQSVGDAQRNTVSDPDAGWGSSTSVFGDYTNGGLQGDLPTQTGPAAAQPAMGGSQIVPIPRRDWTPAAPPPPASITSQQMPIEPQ